MTTIVSIFRPTKGRLVVRLPFQQGSANYRLLNDICGTNVRLRYNIDLRAVDDWLTSANNTPSQAFLAGLNWKAARRADRNRH